MGLGLLGNENDQDSEMERIKRIAKGSEPSIVSPLITKEDIEKLKGEYENSKSEGGKKINTNKVAAAVYATAAYRDAQYATRGRIFMRVCGLNGRSRAAFGRITALNAIEQMDKK